MNIKKFEAFDSGEFDYAYGDHIFVLAKPKKGWDNYGGITHNCPFKNDEFVPCMISGYDHGQRLWIIGEVHAHYLFDFEIIKDSEKELKNIIELYSSAKKYNL
jgi:hypothetical protein